MILIDPPLWPAHGRRWSHLISDSSLGELHLFAADAGVPSRSFEGDHYDVPQERYAELVAAGATPVSGGDLARALRHSGLRFRKRRGERPLGRLEDPSWLPAPGIVDAVSSGLEPPEASTGAADVIVLADGGAQVLLVLNEGRNTWSWPGGGRERPESVRTTAVREVAEETGLRLDPEDLTPVGYLRIVFTGPTPPGWQRDLSPDDHADPATHHVAVFAADLGAAPSLPETSPEPQGEILDLAWVPRDRVPDYLDGHEITLLDAAIDRLGSTPGA